MVYGYFNKIMRIDLNNGNISYESHDEEYFKTFMGGSTLGAKILYDEVPKDSDPFDDSNKVIFATGPFQGTGIPGSAKWSIIAKSPLTSTLGDSAAGGKFGPNFKGCGIDALIVEGKSPKPVYIWITEEKVEIRDAEEIWGKDLYETVDLVREETNEKASIAAIGPAGELKVRYASVGIDKHSYAGRAGVGAIMGSKNLKAVAVMGKKKPEFYDEQKLKEIKTQITKALAKDERGHDLKRCGTPGGFATYNGLDNTPKKYWDGCCWSKEGEALEAAMYNDVLKVKPQPCLYCPLACHRHVSVHDEKYDIEGAGPEYETLAMLGANVLVNDLKAVAGAHDLCNKYGIDVISTGAVIGFAMEAFEKGWIDESDTDGLKLEWANPDLMLDMIHLIGKRQGIGDRLAEGTYFFSKSLGKEEYSVQVRGLDSPGHDPRLCYSLAVNYATGTRGACHYRGCPEETEIGDFLLPEFGIDKPTEYFELEGKTNLALVHQDFGAIMGSAVLCAFMFVEGEASITAYLNALNAATGWNWEVEDLVKSGERMYTFQRILNIRDGKGPEFDTMPMKFSKPAPDGFRKGKFPPFETMIKECYELRGWDDKGYVTEDKIKELNLENFV